MARSAQAAAPRDRPEASGHVQPVSRQQVSDGLPDRLSAGEGAAAGQFADGPAVGDGLVRGRDRSVLLVVTHAMGAFVRAGPYGEPERQPGQLQEIE
jgi:hypothetical protein